MCFVHIYLELKFLWEALELVGLKPEAPHTLPVVQQPAPYNGQPCPDRRLFLWRGHFELVVESEPVLTVVFEVPARPAGAHRRKSTGGGP